MSGKREADSRLLFQWTFVGLVLWPAPIFTILVSLGYLFKTLGLELALDLSPSILTFAASVSTFWILRRFSGSGIPGLLVFSVYSPIVFLFLFDNAQIVTEDLLNVLAALLGVSAGTRLGAKKPAPLL